MSGKVIQATFCKISEEKIEKMSKHIRHTKDRDHVTAEEVDHMISVIKKNDGKWATRNALMVYMTFRHGFRANEICDLKFSDLDFNSSTLTVRRSKRGRDSVHPLDAHELRALRRLQRQSTSNFVFTTARHTPMTRQQLSVIVKKASADLDVHVSVHSLRHGTGVALADKMDSFSLAHYLGHKNLQNCFRYTNLSKKTFAQDPWK